MTAEVNNLESLEQQIADIKGQLETISKGKPENKLSMIVFSGDMDKVLAAFVIATGAVAMGMDVVMFSPSGAHRSSGTVINP
jgi:ornithine carbamoyltransferase